MECRKELTELRQRLIKEWLDEKQKKVSESKNITEWWKAMNWYRRKRKVVNNRIEKETWLNHFKNLLDGVDEVENSIREGKDTPSTGDCGINISHKEKIHDRGNSNKEEDEEAENGEEDLDKPITQEEILDAIRKLKKGKLQERMVSRWNFSVECQKKA